MVYDYKRAPEHALPYREVSLKVYKTKAIIYEK